MPLRRVYIKREGEGGKFVEQNPLREDKGKSFFKSPLVQEREKDSRQPVIFSQKETKNASHVLEKGRHSGKAHSLLGKNPYFRRKKPRENAPTSAKKTALGPGGREKKETNKKKRKRTATQVRPWTGSGDSCGKNFPKKGFIGGKTDPSPLARVHGAGQRNNLLFRSTEENPEGDIITAPSGKKNLHSDRKLSGEI